MDVSKSDQSSKKNTAVETSRLPLISAEKINNGTTRRSRTTEVSSRVRSPSPSAISRSRRSPSPSPNTKTTTTASSVLPKRAISAERKRPSTPSYPAAPSTPEMAPRKVAGARPDAVWPSTVRSLHVSLQSDKLSLPNKKPVSLSNVAHKPSEKTLPISQKPTPERKRVTDQCEDSKLVDGLHARLSDQRRWPTSTSTKVSSDTSIKSMDNDIDNTTRASNALHIGMGVPSLRRMSFPNNGSKALEKPESDSVSLRSFDGSEGEELEQHLVDNVSLRIPSIGSSSLSLDSSDKKSLSPSSVSSESPSPSVASNPISIRGISPSRTRALNSASSRGMTKRIIIDQMKNSKPVEGLHARLLDHCIWPSSTTLKVSSNALTKSTDTVEETTRISSVRRMSFPDFGSMPSKNTENDYVSQGSFDGIEEQEYVVSSVDYHSLQLPKIGDSSSCPASPNKTSSPSLVSCVSPSRARASHPNQLESGKQVVDELHTEVEVSTTISNQSMDAIKNTTRVSNPLLLGMGESSHRRMSFPDFGSALVEKSGGDSMSVVSFDGSEVEDSSADDISLRIRKIGSSSSCPTSPEKTSLSPSSVCSVSPYQMKAPNPALFKGIYPSLTRNSNAFASRGVKKSGVTDQTENSEPTKGLHSRFSEPHRWPSSTVVKVSSSSSTKRTDAIGNVDRAPNVLHMGMGERRMSFPDFGSMPSEKPASDSASLVSFGGSEEEKFEVCSFDDNSLRIPNIVSSSSCPVSPDQASLSPSSVSSVSPSRTNYASARGLSPSRTNGSNRASSRGVSPTPSRATRGISPTPTRVSNTASTKGVSPTPSRATRGISPTPTRVSNAASTRGVSPTPTRATRGVSPTPSRVSNVASTRGVSPTPTRATRGVSPTPSRVSNAASTRGVSPTPTRATRGVSLTPSRVSNVASTRGVSPTPTRATRGVSPTPTRVSSVVSIRGVNPTPTRATRGVSLTPTRVSSVVSIIGVSPTPTRATRGVSPTPTRVTRGVSPTPARVSNVASTRGVSPTPTRAIRGISPTPSTASNVSSPRGVSLTPRALNHVSTRGVSPSRMRASDPPTRGVSPTPLRPSSPSRESSSSTSELNFIIDIKKGNKDASHIEDVHQLRLLDNRHLQWRYANAQANKLLYKQKVAAEKKLYSVWRTNSELVDSLIEKRIDLKELRLKLKLYSVLHKQMTYLNKWTIVEKNHMSILSKAIEDIQKATLKLPVTGGARADIQSAKGAVCSAVDVMQRIGSSICSILSRVEGVNNLVSELARVAAEERALLDECEALFSVTAAMQVEEYSLRTHLVQLKQVWKGDEHKAL